MKKLNEVYDLKLEDYLGIYQELGFNARIVTERNVDCILLSDNENFPLYLVYINKTSNPLNYDDVKNILIDFELEFQDYDCKNYILISEKGYLNKSNFVKDEKINIYDIQSLNIRLEDGRYINELIKAKASNRKYFELNAHNKIAYDNIKKEFEAGNNKIYVRHATGTGKSILVSKYILSECNDNVLLLSSSLAILNQFNNHLDTYDSDKLKLMTYNKLSLMSDNELEQIKNFNPELIILDEFHRCGAKVWGKGVNKLLELCPNSRVLGTSATPVRYLDDARDMGEEIFNKNIVSNIDLCEAIVRGIIPMPTYVVAMYEFEKTLDDFKNNLKESKCKESEKIKAKKILKALNDFNKNSELINRAFNKHIGENRNFVVFCKDYNHMKSCKKIVSKWFNTYIENQNINCDINTYEVYASNSNNKEVISRYTEDIKNNPNKNFNLLFSIEMLNEGIHSRHIDGVILLRPTKSPIIYYQQIGRALHVNPINKPIIFDFVNNSNQIQSQNFISGLYKAYEEINNNTQSLLNEARDINLLLTSIHDETTDILSMFSDIEDAISVSWDKMFERLVKFKKLKGTTIVKSSDDSKLYKWVVKNRYLYSSGALSKYKLDKLDSIGFIVNVQDALWLENYENLKEYKKLYNNTDVTSEYNVKLYRFVKSQRRLYEQKKLSKERINLLESLGMTWNVLSDKWISKYSELVKIYNQLGTLYVIENNPIVTNNGVTVIIDKDLMHWIKCQRTYYTNNKLSDDRIKKLESLGLALNLAEKTWNDNMNSLKLYVKENGHANVQSKDNEKLYNWIKNLIKNKRDGKLDDVIVKELESLGVIWSKRDAIWEENFNDYVLYLKKYNTPLVEPNLEGYNKKLQTWLKAQRNDYKNKKLSEYRQNKLNSIGFVWDTYDYKWMVIYNELKDFIYSLGKKCYEYRLLKYYTGNTPLSSWITTQKKAYKDNSLSEKRFALLTEIGINFE